MKNTLLTISALTLLLAGQSAMAVEQTSSENGFDAAFNNGWIDQPSAQSGQGSMLSKVSFTRQDDTNATGHVDAFSIDYMSKN